MINSSVNEVPIIQKSKETHRDLCHERANNQGSTNNEDGILGKISDNFLEKIYVGDHLKEILSLLFVNLINYEQLIFVLETPLQPVDTQPKLKVKKKFARHPDVKTLSFLTPNELECPFGSVIECSKKVISLSKRVENIEAFIF